MPEAVDVTVDGRAVVRTSGPRITAIVALIALAVSFFVIGAPQALAEDQPGGPPSTQTSAQTETAAPTETSVPTETAAPSESPTATASPSESPSESPSQEPSQTPLESPSAAPSAGPVTVSGATLSWGMSNEASNKAHAPNTYNFFTAGTLSKARAADGTISKSQWRATAGNVTIQKLLKGSWRTATWADLRTDELGRPLVSATSGKYSNLQMSFRAGTGTLDLPGGDATIRWTGSATVVGYSGMSSFRIDNPVLRVTNGVGVLTATLTGFGTDRDAGITWVELPAQTVTLADLPKVTLNDSSFTMPAAYAGVVTPPGLDTAQLTTGAGWGAFPASLVRYTEQQGTASFWYTSGGITDSSKVAKPVSVTFPGATAPVPTPGPGKPERDRTKVPEQVPQPAQNQPPVLPGGGALPSNGAGGVPVAPQPQQIVAAVPAIPASAALTEISDGVHLTTAPVLSAGPGPVVWWWSAAVLLLVAAVLMAIPLPRASARP